MEISLEGIRLAFCLNLFAAVFPHADIGEYPYRIWRGSRYFVADNGAERTDFISTILLKFIRLRLLINPLSKRCQYSKRCVMQKVLESLESFCGFLNRTSNDIYILLVLQPC